MTTANASATRPHEHWVMCAVLAIALLAVTTAPWWWEKLAAVPVTSVAAAAYFRHRSRIRVAELAAEAVQQIFMSGGTVPPTLIPYIDPVRGSSRTGQVVYQFVQAVNAAEVVPMNEITKFVADVTAKALKVTNPATVTTIENATSALVAAGLAVYAAVVAVKSDKPAPAVTK